MENFLKTNTLNKRFDFDTDIKYSPTPEPVTFAHKKVEITGSLTQNSVSDTNSELKPAPLDHKLAKRITESHHNPANLTLSHTKPTLNWVKFLDNPDTLREQLFELTTLKDLMGLHLKQITPPISESLLPLLSRQFPTLGRLWDNHTFLHQDAMLTQKLRKLRDNDISSACQKTLQPLK